jgi:hypothetical protein
MTITVTQEHIDKAWKDRSKVSCINCPVALAIRDKGFDRVKVLATNRVHVDRFRFDAPPEVCSFVEKFDESRFSSSSTPNVAPFTFELGPPC